MITAQAIALLSDNYAWLLRCGQTGTVAVVDPAEEAPVVAAIEAAGGQLDLILLTHHHDDHIAAVEPIRSRYGAPVVGARADAHRLPRLDREVAEGDTVTVGDCAGQVLETPGHTLGHISFYFDAGHVLVCADTLFSLGCGRLLEGTAADMFGSLRKFAVLPPDTLVCCGHEYTESNARFAVHADPDNAALADYAAHVKVLRAMHEPTIPSRLADELACNPFLRAPDIATLAELRRGKDGF